MLISFHILLIWFEGARCCLVNMIVGGGYFEGSHDHNPMAEPSRKADFASERQRREWLNEAFWALRMLLPNPKCDRVSNVEDAIEYIHELNRTVKELKILVEQKWHGTNRKKMIKMDGEAASDGESSSTRPVSDEQQ
nr:transcription factor EAT1 [Aegilops tauschii subsp. strangulata]